MKKMILLLVVVLTSSFWIELMSQSEQPVIDTTKTLDKLNNIANQDIEAIQKEIDKIEKLLTVNKSRTLPQRYGESVVVGDSMVEALSAYAFLPAQNVAGAIGRRTDNIYDQVEIALSRQPKHMFLCLGLNDVTAYRKNFSTFEMHYQNLINYIKQRNPAIQIYLNSMCPLPPETTNVRKEFKYIKDYNKVMQDLCKKNNLTYIDNTQLIEPVLENFGADGVHPTLEYFRLWIQNMADTAMLE